MQLAGFHWRYIVSPPLISPRLTQWAAVEDGEARKAMFTSRERRAIIDVMQVDHDVLMSRTTSCVETCERKQQGWQTMVDRCVMTSL